MKQKSIFKLTLIQYDEDKPKYPKFGVFRLPIGYYSSLEKAEEAMKKCITDKHIMDICDRPLFGFIIKEYAFDTPSYWYAKNRKNYLPDGTLLDESPVHEDSRLEEFLGRQEEKVRFQKGDLVEVLAGDRVTLEIVYEIPWLPEEVHKKKKRSEEEFKDFTFRLDQSDDSYITISHLPHDHSHPNPVDLFPVRLPVTENLKKKLKILLNEN